MMEAKNMKYGTTTGRFSTYEGFLESAQEALYGKGKAATKKAPKIGARRLKNKDAKAARKRNRGK